MEKKSILLCDEDRAYAAALSGYLSREEDHWSVSLKTDPKDFDPDSLNLKEDYDICLLSEKFMEKVSEQKDGTENNVVALLSSRDVPDDKPSIYKFQSMDNFREKLRGYMSGGTKKAVLGGTKLLAVYPPVQTELTLPFTLLLSLVYAKQEKTVLLDMEENSILSTLIPEPIEMSLTDYLYLSGNSGGKGSSIEDCLIKYDDLYILPPVKNPTEISFISENEWSGLLEDIRNAKFTRAILLFDRMHRGFPDMVTQCESIILPGKQDAFYRYSKGGAERFFDSYGLTSRVKEVFLPDSLGGLPDSDYKMEELVRGKLNKWMKENWN